MERTNIYILVCVLYSISCTNYNFFSIIDVLNVCVRFRQVHLKLTTSTGTCYVTANQVVSGSKGTLEINGLYANKLCLSEESKVS